MDSRRRTSFQGTAKILRENAKLLDDTPDRAEVGVYFDPNCSMEWADKASGSSQDSLMGYLTALEG